MGTPLFAASRLFWQQRRKPPARRTPMLCEPPSRRAAARAFATTFERSLLARCRLRISRYYNPHGTYTR